MLTMTEAARNVIRMIPAEPEHADTAGLRIGRPSGTDTGFTVAPADTPAEQDRVVEDDGARVFLDSDATEHLDGVELDARFDPHGRVHFHSTRVA
ncbi:MAG: Fe-S cluster assembly protein HesB [Nocardioides sp.]